MKNWSLKKIIVSHIFLLFLYYIACFVVTALTGGIKGYEVFGWGFLNIIYLTVVFIFILFVSFTKSENKDFKLGHWIGFGLQILLTFPVCLGFAQILLLK